MKIWFFARYCRLVFIVTFSQVWYKYNFFRNCLYNQVVLKKLWLFPVINSLFFLILKNNQNLLPLIHNYCWLGQSTDTMRNIKTIKILLWSFFKKTCRWQHFPEHFDLFGESYFNFFLFNIIFVIININRSMIWFVDWGIMSFMDL